MTDQKQAVTENDQEFLMRTLSPHQWRAVAGALRVEKEEAVREVLDGLVDTLEKQAARQSQVHNVDCAVGIRYATDRIREARP